MIKAHEEWMHRQHARFERRAACREQPQPQPDELEELTPRETEVVQHLATGLSNKHIALAMGVSYRTVQTHLQNIFWKWRCHDRVEVAVLAIERYIGLEEAQQAIKGRGAK